MPKVRKGAKFYAVKVGRQPGVYEVWKDAERQVSGFPSALHQSFTSRKEAEDWLGPMSGFQAVTGMLDIKPTSLDLDAAVYSGLQAKEDADDVKPPPATFVSSLDPVASVAEDPPLTPQQEEVLQRILRGENFFFTGSAGTGKSVLLRAIVKAFKIRHFETRQALEQQRNEIVQDYLAGKLDNLKAVDDGKVEKWHLAITASTGMAAVNIGGCTLHSWAGIGLGQLPVTRLVEMILRNDKTRNRWQHTAALIIDEISMIDGKLFDKLEEIGRRVRGSSEPFGGLQVILSGDFFQLPPVTKADEKLEFAFEAKSWPRVIPKENMLALTRVFRQRESAFVSILEKMRKGRIDAEATMVLKSCARTIKYSDGMESVGLYPSKKEVAQINASRLKALPSAIKIYRSHDQPGINSKGYALSKSEATVCLNKNTIWPEELEVKVGAMVMLVTNLTDTSLVNGSTGKVVDFQTINEATSRGTFVSSRASFHPSPNDILFPVVEFIPPRHATPTARRVLISQMQVDVQNAQGDAEATRYQVPLILAWALTIHKSQGQTIERIKVDLREIFVEGQTYVAISRAVSLDTLEIRNFLPERVKAHSRVIEWARPFEEEQAEDEKWDELLGDADFDF